LLRKRNYAELSEKGEELYESFKLSYPKIYECITIINEYLESLFGEKSPNEEQLYLMLHVSLLYEKQENNQKS